MPEAGGPACAGAHILCGSALEHGEVFFFTALHSRSVPVFREELHGIVMRMGSTSVFLKRILPF